MRSKRLFDLLASISGLVICSPVMSVAAIAIKLETPGPILFRQVRVGRFGEEFTIHKFRSMRVNAEGPSITSQGDARITTVGAFLRKTKIDELPQLYDVLRGDMSLVGPRPEVPDYVALWPERLRDEILTVRPGITDPVTLVLRNEQEILATKSDPERYYREVLLPRKVLGYAEYSRKHSFFGDLGILYRTVMRVLID